MSVPTEPGQPARHRVDIATTFEVRAQQALRRDPRVARDASLVTTDGMANSPRLRRDPRERRDSGDGGQTGRLRLTTSGNSIPGKARREPVAVPSELPLRRVEAPTFFVLAVTDGSSATPSSSDRALLAAARAIADPAGAAVVAYGAGAAKSWGAAGADRIARAPSCASTSIDIHAACIEAVVKQCSARHVIFTDDFAGRDLCLRVAAALNTEPVIGVHTLTAITCRSRSLTGDLDLERPLPHLMTLSTNLGEQSAHERFEGRDMLWELPRAAGQILDLGVTEPGPDSIPLEEAPFIVSAGAGIEDWPSFERVSQLLEATRAGTRVVCDAGRLPRDRQVGASGHRVRARCYLALGISGAVQHLDGIEHCEHIVAINLDAHAPIMKRADLKIIGDANAILRAIVARLEERA